MRGLRLMMGRLRAWLGGRAAGRDLEKELASHVVEAAHDYRATGLSADEARRLALRDLGGIQRVRETVDDVRLGQTIGGLGRDVRIGLRTLRRSPAATAVAIGTLALGVGISTAVFSVVYGVWLNAYPYERAGDILYPRARSTQGQFSDSQNGVFVQREFLEFARVPAVLDSMANTIYDSAIAAGENGPESVPVFRLSARAFQFLGVPPLLGRVLYPSDIGADGSARDAVVLSFKLWTRMFHADPAVVGRMMTLDGVSCEIVGVMPERFGWGSASIPTNDGLYRPLSPLDHNVRTRAWIRLRPGVGQDVATQQFQALFTELAGQKGSFPRTPFATTFREFTAGTGDTARYITTMRDSLRLLMAAVGLLLLIACTNVGNLLLVRGSLRYREVAIRLAIGGSRWQVFRQLLVESLLLALAAGAGGIALAAGLTRLVAALIPRGYVPSESSITMNVPVLLAGLGAAIASGVLCGVAPAFQAARANVNDGLKATAPGFANVRGARVRHFLVALEIALSLVLLTGASLAIRGYLALGPGPAGVDRLMETSLQYANRSGVTPSRALGLVTELPERLRLIPSVERATTAAVMGIAAIELPGMPQRGDRQATLAAVGDDYLGMYQLKLASGRGLSRGDILDAAPVTVVNEAAARLWAPGQEKIGAHVRLKIGGTDDSIDVQVIGVFADEDTLGTAPLFLVPGTLQGAWMPLPTIVVRTRQSDPLRSIDAVRAATRDFDPSVVLMRPVDIAAALRSGRLQPRFNVALFAALGAVAAGLAAAGIFAALSYLVAGRRREIGIRMALGAGRRQIATMVLATGTAITSVGVVLGASASFMMGKLAQSQVFGVTHADPIAIGAAALVLGCVAIGACYLPARRATRVNPLTVLRSE